MIITHTAWYTFQDHEHHSKRLFLSLGHSGLEFGPACDELSRVDFDIRISDLTAILLYTA